MLGIAKISKSSYEYSKNALETEESLDNQRIRMEIKFVWLRSKKRYGYRKITRDVFLRFGDKVNHKKVLRMMNEMGIYANLSGHDKGVPIRVRSARLLRICLRETSMPSILLRRLVPTSPNSSSTGARSIYLQSSTSTMTKFWGTHFRSALT